MRFGPEIDDALGGRLTGDAFLPGSCAPILRALLMSRPTVRLKLGTLTNNTDGNQYALKIHNVPAAELNETLESYRQDGFTEENDLSRALSSKSVRAHLLRRGNACVALLRKSNAAALQKRTYQAIAFLPRLLPGMFAAQGLSETETALLTAAFELDYNAVDAALEKLYKESNLCGQRQRRALQGLFAYRLESELRRVRDEAANAEHSANNHLNHYMLQSQIAVEKRFAVEGLERRIVSTDSDVDEVLAYLDANKTVSVNVENNNLLIDVTGPLTNFDPDAYRVIRDRYYSQFQENVRGPMEDALLFFDALFLEETVKIQMSARYCVEPRYGVRGKQCAVTPAAIPNPHIQYHGCLGQYSGDMQEALVKSDFVGLIALCTASGLSLNVPESPTCGRFIKDVTGGRHNAVLLPGGEAVSYKQAVAWLKQQKGISEEESHGETDSDDYSDD